MSWFKKETPPPPTPSKIPGWVSLLTPIIFAIIIGLLSIVYSGLDDHVKAMEEKKANNETLLMFMKQQEEKDNRQWQAIERQIQAPKAVIIQEPTINRKAPTSLDDTEKPPLSPKEFQDYMNMSPEMRKIFRSLHPAYANLPE